MKKNANIQGNNLKSENNLEENNNNEDDNDEIINFPPLDSDNKIENLKVIIDLPIKEFFNKYLTIQYNETCFKVYYEFLGDHFNVENTDLRQYSENNKNNNNNNFFDCFADNSQKIRNLTFSNHLSGV